MKNYNELLNKMSSQMSATKKIADAEKVAHVSIPTGKDTTSTMLNKIELEVQRQGGY